MSDTTTTDLLNGVEAIAKYLRMTPRQVRHRALTGEIPTFKIGRTVCARESSLTSWLAAAEAAAIHRPAA
ncbi:MAG: DNA-binding protein [Methylorubrum populi]